MRRYLSALKARGSTNIASRAMVNVLAISLILVIIGFIASWALFS
jgi:hypothetical protein